MKIEIDNLTFDARSAGTPGDPLVLLLHGFPQTSHSWRHQLAPLATAGFFAVAPDQRGYSAGARPARIADYRTELLVSDALGIIDRLGYHQAHIVGHDWGGQLSWLLAAHHPDQVASLTVLSRPHPQAFLQAIGNDPQQSERSKHHRAFQDPQSADLLLENNAQRLRQLFRDQAVPEADQNAYLEVLGNRDALDAAINWYRAPAAGGASQPLAPAETPVITQPTLYLWGEQDATVGRMAAAATSEFVTGEYRFEALPEVGHFITDQVGDLISEMLLKQLQRLR